MIEILINKFDKKINFEKNKDVVLKEFYYYYNKSIESIDIFYKNDEINNCIININKIDLKNIIELFLKLHYIEEINITYAIDDKNIFTNKRYVITKIGILFFEKQNSFEKIEIELFKYKIENFYKWITIFMLIITSISNIFNIIKIINL